MPLMRRGGYAWSIAAALLVGASPACAQTPRCSDNVIRSDGVGALRIGMPVDSIRVICSVVRDTSEMTEAESQRVIYALVGSDTIKVNVFNNRIGSMVVERPTYVTADSIRVGMPVAEFLKRWHPEVGAGEGKMFMWDDRNLPGLSFGLSHEAYRSRVNKSNLSRLPRSTHIDLILVRGR